MPFKKLFVQSQSVNLRYIIWRNLEFKSKSWISKLSVCSKYILFWWNTAKLLTEKILNIKPPAGEEQGMLGFCLSFYLSIYLSIYLFIYLKEGQGMLGSWPWLLSFVNAGYLSIRQRIHMPIYLSTYISIFSSVYLSIYLPLSFYFCACLSTLGLLRLQINENWTAIFLISINFCQQKIT